MGSLLASNYFKQKFWKFYSLSSSNLRMINHISDGSTSLPSCSFLLFLWQGSNWWDWLTDPEGSFSLNIEGSCCTFKVLPDISALVSFYFLPCTFSFSTPRAVSDIFISEVLGSGASDCVLIRGQMSINLLLISLGWKLLISSWLLGSSCPGIALWRD